MNIFRKKSRKKIVAILLVCIFANYFISPLYVLAGSYLSDIGLKMTEIDLAFTEAESLNDSEKIKESCVADKYCELATAKISTDLETKKVEYTSIKGDIKLKNLVAIVGSPANYDKLLLEQKEQVVNYQSLTELSNTEVIHGSCMVLETVDPNITTEADCTLATGTWTAPTSTLYTVTVDSIEAKINDYLASVKTLLEDYVGEEYLTTLTSSKETLRSQDVSDAQSERNHLISDFDALQLELENALSAEETFLTAHPTLELELLTKTELMDYIEIYKEIYEQYDELIILETEYNELINNLDYQIALGEGWSVFIESLSLKYDETNGLFSARGLQDAEKLKIEVATNIDNLDSELVADSANLSELLAYIRSDLTMVSQSNIDKIIAALLNNYILLSNNSDVVINHDDKSIIVSNKLLLEKTVFESYLSIANNGSFVATDYKEVVTLATELEEEIINFFVKTGMKVQLFTATEVMICEYVVTLVGDSNSDATIDALDLAILEDLVLGNTTASEYSSAVLSAMDLNLDQELNISDIVLLYSLIQPVVEGDNV